MNGVSQIAQKIRDIVSCKSPLIDEPCDSSGDLYEGLTGQVVASSVVSLWSSLGGVSVFGTAFETEVSSGITSAARTREAEAHGPGVPSEVLDGSVDGAVRMVWWDRNWVPIVVNADEAIVVDYAPGLEGVSGQVVYCDMDIYFEREALWSSVEAFVSDVAWIVGSKAIEFDEFGFASVLHDSGRSWPLISVFVEVGRARRMRREVPFPILREVDVCD